MRRRGTLIAGIALGLAVFAAPASAATFNGGAITITDNAAASPYGAGTAAINISGMTGTITDLNIGITGFTHGYTDDVGAMLVAPNGAALDFMDGPGLDDPANPGTAASSANLLVDDSAGAQFPDTGATLPSGSYKPTDDYFSIYSAPAPAAPNRPGPAGGGTATLASTFNGAPVNGTWKLFVQDFVGGFGGTIDSWRLEISGVSVAPVAAAPTGLRAAALKKCKKKFKKTGNKKKYRKCKKRARLLPV